jgi:adenylyltransferase/sulfurtransferase
MPVTIIVPGPMRELCGGRGQLTAAGATVGEVLAEVARAHPLLGARLLDESGQVRRYVGLFLGEEEVRELGGLAAPVRDGDRLSLVPAIAGGARELDGERIARWARQLLVPGFGAAGQERLMAARVRVVGAGGQATPALLALVQAGVGTLWIDDPETIGPGDLCGWLYRPEQVGQPRATVAATALAGASRFVEVRPYPTGGAPSATLVCAASSAQALASAEAARRARIPHVVVEIDGEAGQVVTIPPGAPCFACARFSAAGERPPVAGSLVLASLAAQELLRLLVEPGVLEGRRLDLVRGVPTVRVTQRLPGCVCGAAVAGAEPGAEPGAGGLVGEAGDGV